MYVNIYLMKTHLVNLSLEFNSRQYFLISIKIRFLYLHVLN